MGGCTVVAWLARLNWHRVLSLHFFFVHYRFGDSVFPCARIKPDAKVQCCQNAYLPLPLTLSLLARLRQTLYWMYAGARPVSAPSCASLKFQANGTHGVAAQNLFGFVWGVLGQSPGRLESQPHFRASFPRRFWQLVGKWLILPGSCPWQPKKNVVCISWEQSEQT